MKRKQELTSCAHPQFNGMHTIRSISHNTVRKEYKPVYIFIDCSVSMKHFDNFFFLLIPDPPLLVITAMMEEIQNVIQLINVTIAIVFLDIGKNLTNILNIASNVRALYILLKIKILNVSKITLNIRKIFPSLSLEISKLRPVIFRELREG